MKRARRCTISLLGLFVFSLAAAPLPAQEVPKAYQEVLTFLGHTGDFKAKVLKANIPRNDLLVTILEQPAPTPFGFGGWIAMTKGDGGAEVLMGDLVLTQFEVNPVHHHMLGPQLLVIFFHYWGRGPSAKLAAGFHAALDALGK